MASVLRQISLKALALGFFIPYVLPFVIAWLLLITVMTFVPSVSVPGTYGVVIALLWTAVLAPFAAGYLAAKFAPSLPLLHGLLVAVPGLLLYATIAQGRGGAWWLLWITLCAAFSVFGAWFWRYRTKGIA